MKQDTQYHERTAWKILSLADAPGPSSYVETPPPIDFEPQQLAQFLYGVSRNMFTGEDAMALLNNMTLERLKKANLVHYVRATFAMLMKLVKDRLNGDWDAVMEPFLDYLGNTTMFSVAGNHYQDLMCQLHLNDVYSVDTLLDRFIINPAAVDRVLCDWDEVPPVVCITLVAPRSAAKALEDLSAEKVGTPPLQCEIRGPGTHNIFTAISIAFGSVSSTGSNGDITLTLAEDVKGWAGSSSLVVSFFVPSWLLTEAAQDLTVGFALRNSVATVHLAPIMGLELLIFQAAMTEKERVFVSRDRPNFSGTLEHMRAMTYFARPSPAVAPTCDNGVRIALDNSSRQVSTFSLKRDIIESKAQEILASGIGVTYDQISPCSIKVAYGDIEHLYFFPFPVDGSKVKLRIARKSHFIEARAYIAFCAFSG